MVILLWLADNPLWPLKVTSATSLCQRPFNGWMCNSQLPLSVTPLFVPKDNLCRLMVLWRLIANQPQDTNLQSISQNIMQIIIYAHKPDQRHLRVLQTALPNQHWCRVWVQARMRQLVHTVHVPYRETHRDFHTPQCQECCLLCHVHNIVTMPLIYAIRINELTLYI